MARAQRIDLARLSIIDLVDAFIAVLNAAPAAQSVRADLLRWGEWLVMTATLALGRRRQPDFCLEASRCRLRRQAKSADHAGMSCVFEEARMMSEPWQHQVRLYVDEAGRVLLDDPANKLLPILRKHDAILVSQLDAFEAFLSDPAQAASPLGRWTAMTLADPEKRAKHRLAIAVRIGGAEVYDRAIADALEDDLRPLVEDGTLLRISRHDTNPASNLPIPAEYRS